MPNWLVWTDWKRRSILWRPDGLYGSAIGRELAAWNDIRIRGCFSLDMIGDRVLNVARETGSVVGCKNFIAQAANQLGYTGLFPVRQISSTTNNSFIQVGIPAVDVVDGRVWRMGIRFDAWANFTTVTRHNGQSSQHSLEILAGQFY